MFKTILIKGATSGIGKGLALHYAKPKRHLFLTGRNEERLQEVQKLCGEKGAIVKTSSIDVTDQEKLHDWILQCDNTSPIDLVIANAGISTSSMGEKSGSQSLDAQRKLFQINIEGVLNTIFPILPRMQKRKSGQIALMSSMSAFRGLPRSPAYSASKAFLKVYGEGMGARWRKEGIYFSTICPGFVETPLTNKNPFSMPFAISVDKAVNYIEKGIAKRKAIIPFPWQMHVICYILSILPTRLAQLILDRFGSGV